MAEKAEITLGTRVTAPDRLVRHVDYRKSGVSGRDWKGWVYEATRWPSVSKPKPVAGIVVGVRTVHEWGWRSWMGDEGMQWKPEGARRVMVLVTENLRHAPARVWLEDVVPKPSVPSTKENDR